MGVMAPNMEVYTEGIIVKSLKDLVVSLRGLRVHMLARLKGLFYQ